MKLVIDLCKAGTLDTSKLVKKPIRVRGQDGKVYTRMQWVKPGEIPGVKSSGKGKDEDNKFPNVTRMHAPRDIEKEKEVEDNTKSILEESHSSSQESKESMESIRRGDDLISSSLSAKTRQFLQKFDVHPEINEVVRDAIRGLAKTDNMKADLWTMNKEVLEDWNKVKTHIKESITSTTSDVFIRNVQLGALSDGNTNHELSLASHPVLAREAVDKLLGKYVADEMRKDMDEANLSINFPKQHTDKIKEEGYKSSSLESYVEKTMGEEGLKQLDEILGNDSFYSESARINSLGNMSDNWGDVSDRARAEYDSIGLTLEDRKPTYIAFNPINNPTGAAKYYGNAWLTVDPEVLSKCTMTFDDSFGDTRSIAKIWDMEHLKNAFILKCIERHPNIDSLVKDGLDSGVPWYGYSGDIPLEIQLHETGISSSQLTMQRDPSDVTEVDLDSLDDIGEYELEDVM